LIAFKCFLAFTVSLQEECDDDEGAEADKEEDAEEKEMQEAIDKLSKEFDEVHPRWLRYRKKFDWKLFYPALEGQEVMRDLMFLSPSEVGRLYKHLDERTVVLKIGDKKEVVESAFGLLPKMAMSSAFQIGGLAAESFCERVIWEANRTVQADNTALNCDEVEMRVMLRMNNDFINYMLQKYADLFLAEWKAVAVAE
jgi:hypothetical protein